MKTINQESFFKVSYSAKELAYLTNASKSNNNYP